MRLHEIEAWAIGIIQRVVSGQPVEDSRVVVKAAWPDDPRKAARQIAGHANAARGEPVLWLIGVDEAAGTVPGVTFSEFSSWYNSVSAAFDELAPEPKSINVPTAGVTVAALLFDTERAPFVVKNAEGGTIQREVPWREATGVRSATRSQLLKLLSPLQKLPEVEVVGALLTVKPWESQNGGSHLQWNACTAIFLTQPQDQEVVIAKHRCTVTIKPPGRPPVGPLSGVEFRGPRSGNVRVSEHAVTLLGCGLFEIRHGISSIIEHETTRLFEGSARLEIRAKLPGVERPLAIDIELAPRSRPDGLKGTWFFGDHTFYA
ncbi:MAG: hypothetical protein ABSG86_05470 [Thermoguttaceae bacterium]|jgi:hypothetical protein